jgi:hypothetical protein
VTQLREITEKENSGEKTQLREITEKENSGLRELLS